MPEQESQNDSLRRCFLLASRGAAADTVASLLTDRGIECLRPEDLLVAGAAWSDELTRHLTLADFVVAILPSSASAQIAFELGLAHGLSKPALVIATGKNALPEDLRGLAVVRVSDLQHIAEAVPELDRFLRHAMRARSSERPAARRQERRDLEWARERLAALRASIGVKRGFGLERLVADVFERAGAEVQPADAEPAASDDAYDLAVWSDDLAYEMGGGLLVECNVYRGGAGSVARKADHTMRRLEDVVQRSDAVRLAILVFDYDGPGELPQLFDTPRVLAFPVEQLLDTVERGALTEEVLARRRQAAYARGRSRVDHAQ